jgi:hypothetical protein
MERFGTGIIADQLTEVSSVCFVSLSHIVGDRTAAAKKIPKCTNGNCFVRPVSCDFVDRLGESRKKR